MPKQKIDLQKREFVFNLIKTLSQPSLGCTEIGLIALAATIASEILKGKISKANVKISPYIYRNVAHIGVPLLGFCGVNMIAASGFIIKNSRSGLALLCDLNPSKITQVKSLSKRISHDIVNDVDPVFCAINATDSLGNNAQVVIEKYHDNVTSIILNNKKIKIPSKFQQQEQTTSQSNLQYAPEDITLSDLITIVDSFSLSELSFLKKGVSLNDAIARYGIKHNSKNGLTSAFINSIPALKQHSWKRNALLLTAAAIEARMSGCTLPVMTSNLSGDHGLTLIIPIVVWSYYHSEPKLTMLRAIALGHMLVWIIKQNIGELSAYCGSVIAAVTAVIGSLGYLRKYSIDSINDLINLNMCATTGILCDGAKPSCAYKICTALWNGFLSLEMVVHHGKIKPKDGVIEQNTWDTISNMGYMSKNVMETTNNAIVNILRKK